MSGADFTVEVDQNPYLPPDGTRMDAIVTVTGPDTPAVAADVLEIVVVDCSGSMLGTKMAEAITATAAAITALPDGVLFAVVAGNSRAVPVYPGSGAARAGPATRAEAVAAVRELTSAGGTRPVVWLDAVRRIAAEHPGAVRHALLLTDGRGADTADELARELDACRGVFTCDCRGIGTDWAVAELRTIATALLGGVDIVADVADLPADMARVLDVASRRSVPDVVLRLWTPEQARVRAVTQVAPEIRELTGRLRPAGPRRVEVPLGDWGRETREYHLRVDVPARPARDRMLAARVGAGPRPDPAAPDDPAGVQVLVVRSADPGVTGVVRPRVRHYAEQVELARAVRDGLDARRDGDDETATVLLGRAHELARRSGHDDTLALLRGVVRATGTGEVALRTDVTRVDEMTLDTRGGRSVPGPDPSGGV